MKGLGRQSFYLLLVVSLLFALVGCSDDDPSREELLVGFVTDGTFNPPGSVQRYNVRTGMPLGSFASGGGLTGPVGLAFGPDGDLYVSDIDNGAVLRYNGTTGVFLNTVVGNIPHDFFVVDPQTGEGFPIGPLGIAFGADGNLYVSNSFTNDVTRYDVRTGLAVGRSFGASELSTPTGVVFGPDGTLYVGSFDTGTVERYNRTTGAFLGTFASGGGLDGPEQLAFGPDGHLYVGSFNSNDVKRYNGTTGAFLGTFASGGGLLGPTGVAFGPDGNLYVSSNSTGEVLRYNGTTGAFLDVFVPFVPGVSTSAFPAFLVFVP